MITATRAEFQRRCSKAYAGVKRFFEALERHAAGITAIFTAFLTLSTALLWWTTKQMRDDTQSSIDASRRLADAAVRLADTTQRSVNASERLADGTAESNRLSKDNFVRQQRPWIAVQASVASDFNYDPRTGDASIVVLFAMTNLGHSPAVDANITATLYTTTADRNHPLIEQKKICDPARAVKKPPHPYDFGEMIFPGATAYSKQVLSLPKSEIEKFFAYSDHHWFDATLVGCVDYRFTFEGDHHQTGFIRDLLKESNEKPGVFVIFNYDEGNVPAAKIRFRTTGMGSYAD